MRERICNNGKNGEPIFCLGSHQEMSGLTEEELLSPSHIEPNRIQNIPEAAECIRACAITQGMPVVIVGDYDADGITSTAILVKLLGHLACVQRPSFQNALPWVRYLGVL